MADVIHLLSDHIANQIAAGEVIQRPASAVKELLENAIDSGATEIQLIVKDAGKEFIQVIDNGKGMSPTDARMSFERHATSKIRNINDLFTIRTMGFRGEALASIAAVTQVEMKTRQAESEAGTRIVIEGTEVKLQEPCGMNAGTNITLKNLFYNVPARRHFLKSTSTELRHILDEFTRIALSHPQITFRFTSNGVEQFHLASGSLKARVIGLLGNSYEKKLVPAEEHTEFLNIHGFIGKPEAATRSRGMQFFFINNRFIRNAYLHHAVVAGFQGLIEKETFPFYVLFLEIDPARVDVNVHPTKQEVKFEDDRMMYSYLNAAVKHSLARYNIAPSLDFTLNPEIQALPSVNIPATEKQREETQDSYLFNVFTNKNQAYHIERKDSLKEWKSLYEIATTPILPEQPESGGQDCDTPPPTTSSQHSLYNDNDEKADSRNILLIHGEYLASTVKSGLMLIHIRRAQERIWYERLQEQCANQSAPCQQVLFPTSYQLPPQDAMLLSEVLPDLARIGFDIAPFGHHTFAVQGLPSGMPVGDEKNMIDEIIDHLKHESGNVADQRTDHLIKHLARRLSRNTKTLYQHENQRALIDELFACSQPEYTPSGKKIFTLIRKNSLDDLLD